MDTISIETKLAQLPTLQITAQSELMKNYLGALPASPEKELFAVHDSRSRPIVFGCSPDGRLYAIHHQDDSATGWTQVDLSAGLADLGAPVTFAAGQLPGGNIFLAVGVRDKADPSRARIAIAGPLSPDLASTDWAHLGSAWSSLPAAGPASQVEKILIGPVDDGQGMGIPIIAVSFAGSDPGAVTTFLARSQVAPSTGAVRWSWIDFPTPTVKSALKDFALGAIADLGAGVYTLYEGEGASATEAPGTGGTTWLVFKTFPDERGRSFDRQLLAPAGARCLATSPGNGKTTALFVGGSGGIHHFAADNQAKRATPVPIAAPEHVPELLPGGLIVRGDQLRAGVTSVWALDGEDLIYFNDAGQAGAWTRPVLLRGGVARIAPLSNTAQLANELIYIGTDVEQTRTLGYMWQDPTTTLWKSDRIPLASTGHLYELDCYTTHLSFEDGAGVPVTGRTLRLGAGARLRVIVNGVAHLVGDGVEVEVQTDAQGNLTVINPVQDLATPLLHLRGDFFDGVLDIDPAHNVLDRLRQGSAAGDLPVLPARLPYGLAAADVAGALQSLVKLHPQSGAAAAPAVSHRLTGQPATGLRTSHLPAGSGFSLSFAGQGLQAHDRAAVAAFSFGDWIERAAGDALEFLRSAAHRVTHFAVTIERDAVSFVAHLGETAMRFVITTAEQLYKVIAWVFHKLEVAFEALVQWLGYLFEWKDIWRTHERIAAMARNGLDYVAARADGEVARWERRVDELFDHLAAALPSIKVPRELGARPLTPSGAGGLPAAVARALKSPIGNWSFYQLQHGGLAGSGDPGPGHDAPSGQHASLLSQLEDGFVSTARALRQSLLQLTRAWQTGTASFSEVASLAAAPLVAALEPLRALVKQAFEWIRSMIRSLRGRLDAALPVPFLGTLYRWLTGLFGEAEQLTFINGLSLLIAIPATLISKISGHGAPFSGSDGLEGAASFELLLGAPATSPATRLAAASPAAGERGGDGGKLEAAKKGYLKWGGLIASIAGLLQPNLRLINTTRLSLAIGSSSSSSAAGTELQIFNRQDYGTFADNTPPVSHPPSGFRGLSLADQILLPISVVLDVVQMTTTFPLPQKALPAGSAAYVLRVGAWVARGVAQLVSYGVQLQSPSNAAAIGGIATMIGDFITSGLALGASAASLVAGHPPSTEQWLADGFSNIGGFTQGLADLLALFAEPDLDPTSRAAILVTAWTLALGGAGAAEAGAALSIHMALSSGDSDQVVFTNPGG